MKFLLDAHLPPGLKRVFATAGHDAIHTMDLPMQTASKDGVLNTVSMSEQRVVVSKDTDFYYYTFCMAVRGSSRSSMLAT